MKLSESPGESYLIMRTEGLVFFKSIDKKTLQCTWMDTAFHVKKTFTLSSLISSKVQVSLYDKVLHKFTILVRKGDKVQLVKCDPETENNEVYVFNFPKSIQHLKMTSTQTSLWILGEEKKGVLRAYNFNYVTNKIQKIDLAMDGRNLEIRSLQVLGNSKLSVIYSYLKKRKGKQYYDIAIWDENCAQVASALLSEFNDKRPDTVVMLDIQSLGENEYFISGQVTSPPYVGFDNFICMLKANKEIFWHRFRNKAINKEFIRRRTNSKSDLWNLMNEVENAKNQIYSWGMPIVMREDTIIAGYILYNINLTTETTNYNTSNSRVSQSYIVNKGYRIEGGACMTFSNDGKLLFSKNFHMDMLDVTTLDEVKMDLFYMNNWYIAVEKVFNRANLSYVKNDSLYYGFTEFISAEDSNFKNFNTNFQYLHWFNQVYLVVGTPIPRDKTHKKSLPSWNLYLDKAPIKFNIK